MDKDNNSSTESAEQEENSNSFNTIFDDVFRTIAQKMPFLLIPLINEVFGTSYREDQEFQQLRNEHYEKFGKIITDSIIRLGEHLYHIECQSKRDGDMALRMVEYDFAIAVEHSSKMEDGIIVIDFPESCVLYVRNHRDMPDRHEVRIRFSDGQTVTYKVPVLLAQNYTVDRIFEKRMLLLLPYHILRYEHFLKSKSTNQRKMNQLLKDYSRICEKLQQISETGNTSELYVDLLAWINQLSDYIIPDNHPVKERLGEIMGGQVLKLRSEELIEQGIEQGITQGISQGRILENYSMVQDGSITPERAAVRLNITVSKLREQMEANGYQYPKQEH